jgi:SAM-dependent methyltransferase
MKNEQIDKGKDIDWGKASQDYARFRPGYPQSFFDLLAMLEVGLSGQKILDLGTGTGVLARAFAARGAQVSGVDIAAGQIEAARQLSAESNLTVDFLVSPVEEIDFPPDTWDVVSVGQAWIYFNERVLVPKLQSMLKPRGKLVLTHLNWLPQEDETMRQSEALVLKYNPAWGAAGYNGDVQPNFSPGLAALRLTTFHCYSVALPFTRESWRGRIRASRGVGASMTPEQMAAFDEEHARLLDKIVPPEFTILHQIVLHIYENVKA